MTHDAPNAGPEGQDSPGQDPSNTDIDLLTAPLEDGDDVLTLVGPDPGVSADPALDYDGPDIDPVTDVDPTTDGPA